MYQASAAQTPLDRVASYLGSDSTEVCAIKTPRGEFELHRISFIPFASKNPIILINLSIIGCASDDLRFAIINQIINVARQKRSSSGQKEIIFVYRMNSELMSQHDEFYFKKLPNELKTLPIIDFKQKSLQFNL